MSDPNTINILCVIGGGARGHLPNEFAEVLFNRMGIDHTKVWQKFQVVAGASIGGIITAAYGYGYSPADVRPFFTEKGKRLFTIRTVPVGCDADTDGNRPNLAQKALLFATSDPFYKSPCSPTEGNSNYGDNILQESLIDRFGTDTLQDIKTNILIPSLSTNTNQFKMFSNFDNPFYTGKDEKIVDVLRATSAAPIYLPSYSFGGNTYIDGGIFCNNVALEALQFAKLKFPKANRFCIFSLGTGRGQYSFDGSGTPTNDLESLATQAMHIFGQAMDGQSASVDRILKMKALYNTTETVFYYDFNPAFAPEVDKALDNTAPEFQTYLTDLAATVFNNDLAEIDTVLDAMRA